MGLDCSHDAFSGAYSAFNRLRQAIARSIGGSYPPHEDKNLNDDLFYWPDSGFDGVKNPGLLEFFTHSDCDGEISPEMCAVLADELEPLLPALEKMGGDSGHLFGGYAAITRKFIDGLRLAASQNEPLEFY